MRTQRDGIARLGLVALVSGFAFTACGDDDSMTEADGASSRLAVGESSLWSDGARPTNPNVADAKAVELGVRFETAVDGFINGVRYYKSTDNKGPHVAHLWSDSGVLLGAATFAGETRSGWQTVRFATPIPIRAGSTYVASYHTDTGHYAGDTGYFAGRSVDSGPLHAPADTRKAPNGVYRYGASGFPSDTYRSTNYWVDVVFKSAATVTDAGGAIAEAGSTPAADASAGDGGALPPITSSPDPSVHDCAAVPSKCGYPDGTNTGPRPGTVFKRVPQDVTSGPGWAWENNFGRLRVTGAGAEISGLDVSGPVVIDAQNVTFRDSIVTTCGSEGDVIALRAGRPADGYNGNGAKILYNRLRCATAGARARSGVRDIYGAAENALIRGNDISGTGNGITLERNGVAVDNWIHDLGHLAGDHHSGLSNHGGASSVVYRHNTALLANTSTAGGGGLSGAITVYGDFARAQNVTVTDNLVSGGAYTFYGGINNEDVYGQPIEIHIDQNRLVCKSWVYGPVFRRAGATNTWNGNYCDQDGAAVQP